MRLNKLAAGEEVLNSHPHHNFGNFTDTKISLKKVQSILFLKEKNQLFLLGVANFPGDFSQISKILTISNFYEILRKKSQWRQFTWLVSTEINSVLLFCFCQHFAVVGIFSALFCKNRIPGFHGFIAKMMTSWSLWVCQSSYR